MKSIFERSGDLFKGILLEGIYEHPTFIHQKSVFSDPWYNFISPVVGPDELNWEAINKVIDSEKA